MDRRQQLIEAGKIIFARVGYHRAKVSDIVREAGVAQGTFYLYFDSKQSLFLTLMETFFALIEQAFFDMDVTLDDTRNRADLTREIHATLIRILKVYRDNVTLARIFLQEGLGQEPDVAQAWEAFTDRLAASGAAYLDLAIKQGVIPSQNSMIVAYCIIGMIERVAYFWLIKQNGGHDLESVARSVIRYELVGITGHLSPDMAQILSGEDASLPG